MRKFIILALAVGLGGCAQQAVPYFYNGAYYMAGDESCARVQAVTTERVNCISSNGQITGYRDAMTSQEIQMYQFNRALQAQKSAEMDQWLQAQSRQTAYQPMPSMAMPQVAPLVPSGGQTVRCISTGFYTNCRY